MYLLRSAVDICTEEYAPLWNVVGFVIDVIKIGIPILLIVIGMIDFAKAVIANKDDVQKKALNTIGKRFLYAVGVFASVWLVTLVLDLAADTIGHDNNYYAYDEASWKKCWALITGATGSESDEEQEEKKLCYYCSKFSSPYVWSNSKPENGCNVEGKYTEKTSCEGQNQYCYYCKSSFGVKWSKEYNVDSDGTLCSGGWTKADKIKKKDDCSKSNVEKEYGKCYLCNGHYKWGIYTDCGNPIEGVKDESACNSRESEKSGTCYSCGVKNNIRYCWVSSGSKLDNTCGSCDSNWVENKNKVTKEACSASESKPGQEGR